MSRKPDFFIVGAPKCGTTSLHAYLRAHPQVFMPASKEPHQFGTDLDFQKNRLSDEAYLRLFAGAGDARRIGEASVFYLFSTRAAREIKAFQPDARILIMLRDPVQMMYSLHGQFVYMIEEDLLDFQHALDAQDDRRQGRRLPPGSRYANELQYVQVASYTDQVARYFDVFGRERVFVRTLDDLSGDPAGTYRQTLEFLEVDPTFQPSFEVHNPARWTRARGLVRLLKGRPRLRALVLRVLPAEVRRRLGDAYTRVMPSAPRPGLSADLHARLREQFRPEIQRLGDLLQRDLSHWCAAPAPATEEAEAPSSGAR